MNLTRNAKLQTRNPQRESGSATVLVFVLVVILVAILASNQLVLHNLKRELKLVEQKQLKQFQSQPARPAPLP